MSKPVLAALLAQGAPLAACAIILVFLRARKSAAAAVAIAAMVFAFAATAWLVWTLAVPATAAESAAWAWLPVGERSLTFGVLLDPLSTVMALVVTAVTLAVMVYSLGYMHGDEGFARYYGFLSLFAWAMLGLVLASNLLQTLVFWELVGLASFLLIGFWFEKPAPAAAARKAFLMTRVGDVGFLLGVLLLMRALGNATVPAVQAAAADGTLSARTVTIVAALLLMGVIGKSAQGPLFTWLPDAMEGPTPVSALLHSATMVAAGVYLVARFHGLFVAAPAVMQVLLWMSVLTALAAALMAAVQTDIKRVLAFSSISQLAYMLMALAAGSVAAGFFHLVTHAGFKALLFLAAGILIHRAHANDMRNLSRSGARSERAGAIGLVAGSLALAGVIPFAGWFSKEAVLAALGEHAGGAAVALAYATAGLTAYYAFRMVFLTLRGDVSTQHAAHSTSQLMNAPVLVLSVLTLLLGFLGPWLFARLAPGVEHHSFEMAVGPLVALTLSLSGIGLAWLEFGKPGASRTGFIERMPVLRAFLAENLYLDRLYGALFVRPAGMLARVARWNDQRVLDGATDGAAAGAVRGGRLLALLQSGQVQLYLAVGVGAVAALGIWIVYAVGAL